MKLFFSKKSILLTVIICLFIVGVSLLLYKRKINSYSSKNIYQQFTPDQNSIKDPYAGWNIFSDPEYGFSFRYPPKFYLYRDWGSRMRIYLDPNERSFDVYKNLASNSAQFEEKAKNDKQQLTEELLQLISNNNVPLITIEAQRRYSNFTDSALDGLDESVTALEIHNLPAFQKKSQFVRLMESEITPAPVRNKTVTVIKNSDIGYIFSYLSRPQENEYYDIYDLIIDSFSLIPRNPTPTNSFASYSLPVLNPAPSFDLNRLRGWPVALNAADVQARLYRVEYEIVREAEIQVNYTLKYTSDSQKAIKNIYVQNKTTEGDDEITVSDPDMIRSLDNRLFALSPITVLQNALFTFSSEEESEINSIHASLDYFPTNPASFEFEPVNETVWLVAVYKKDTLEPVRFLINANTGNVIFKK